MANRQLLVSLSIPKEEYLRVYRGTARTVFAYTREGRSIQFPVNILQSFVKQDGVHGDFVIEVDSRNKFVSIKKVE